MPSRFEEDSVPLWLWPNLLSLDAPLIAVLWQGFLAHRFGLPLGAAGRIVLGLTVWAIYLFDRLLDARKPQLKAEPARHRFYRRHWRFTRVLLILVVAIDASIAALYLRPVVLRGGFVALSGVILYLAAFHGAKGAARIPKEIGAAMLFTAGTFLTAWATVPCPSLAWPALAFFSLCLANMIAIEGWEWRELSSVEPHPLTRWLARTYLFWVPAAAAICALASGNAWYTSIAVSAAASAVLFFIGRRVPMEARRVLVDAVLLSPLLFLARR